MQNRVKANMIPPRIRPWMTLPLSVGDLRPPQAIDTTVWFEPNIEAMLTNKNVRKVIDVAIASKTWICQWKRGMKERKVVDARIAATLGTDGIFISLSFLFEAKLT
jgi:hypothetical protein